MKRTPFPIDVCPPRQDNNGHQLKCTKKLFKNFWSFSVDRANQLLEQQKPGYWVQKGEQLALELFHSTAERVPAYKDFLRKKHVQHQKIKTIEDFKKVPIIDKKDYLNKYSIEELSFDGKLSDAQIISVSSGSSGEPFFWPRSGLLELETTYIQEMYLKRFFHIDKHTTLYVNCFAMGMYIAGPIILNSALRISQKGYPMVVITPGLSMDDILRVLPTIGAKFDQIIIAGYPPYVKDIIEEGAQQGIVWSKMKLRLILAGEGFSEQWRDRVAEMASITDKNNSIINLYGTADASIVGHETPESITIRRFIDEDKELSIKLFGDRYSSRLPTFVQYLPTQKYFEEINNEIHFTATSGIPLIRYNMHDDGGIISYSKVSQSCKERGFDITQALCQGTNDPVSWKLPFVYLYGRSDFTVVIYGANVYPENIKTALESKELTQSVSGRFTMTTEYNHRQDPYLLIHVELAQEKQNTKALEKNIQSIITNTLLHLNDEYRSSYNAKGDMMMPVIQLHEKGDQQFFTRSSIKQRWTQKKS